MLSVYTDKYIRCFIPVPAIVGAAGGVQLRQGLAHRRETAPADQGQVLQHQKRETGCFTATDGQRHSNGAGTGKNGD